MKQRGFTLIELLVTLAIVALLGTLVVPLAQTTVQRRDEQELRRALRDIRSAIDAYKKAGDEGRIAKAGDASGYPERLELLVEGVPDLRSERGARVYFLRRLPRDPFYRDPDASAADSWGKRSYASEPDAPQEGDDVYDIYSMSERSGLNGVPYRQW